MKVGVFTPGIQHSWQTALALQQLQRLQFYATTIFYRPDRLPFLLERYVPGKAGAAVRREFSRFAFDRLDGDKVVTPGSTAEWAERAAARAGFLKVSRRLNEYGNRRFAAALSRMMDTPEPFAVWGFNSSSRDIFAAARAAGRIRVLDRTIGDFRYFNRQLEIIRETHADWFVPGIEPYSPARIARDDEEYELADAIVCGSEFAAQTVRDHARDPAVADKVRVLPYCFDEKLFGAMPAPSPVPRDGPVRFLFCGLASLRKGFHHVLEAIAQLPRFEAELTVVGQPSIPARILARYEDRITLRYTVPRQEMPDVMADHHVLLFPSYFEGSALSLIEGLASGLALIQTRAAGNGATRETGILLDRPDTDALLTAMRAFIDDRDRLDSCRQAAQIEAQKYTFSRYRENVDQLLTDLEA